MISKLETLTEQGYIETGERLSVDMHSPTYRVLFNSELPLEQQLILYRVIEINPFVETTIRGSEASYMYVVAKHRHRIEKGYNQ